MLLICSPDVWKLSDDAPAVKGSLLKRDAHNVAEACQIARFESPSKFFSIR